MRNRRGEVLIAILNHPSDFRIARDRNWYRIPIDSAHKWVGKRWPPEWVAFYLTKPFGEEAYSVRYYAQVLNIRQASRAELFPNEPATSKGTWRYYQLLLGPIQTLSPPVLSRRRRRITFIPTTWTKFITAAEINDLSDESPLEDRLWAELKRRQIPAERQEFVSVKSQDFALDFAVYCAKGKLALETDGDTWHANPKKAAEDNVRDNALESDGWRVLRFTTSQVNEQMAEYCVPTITTTINNLGGVDEGGLLPRRVTSVTDVPYQPSLFDSSDHQ